MKGQGFTERRASPRRTRDECSWLIAARLRPGRDVRVLDVSAGGALVEVTGRLLPGVSVVLYVVAEHGRHTIRGTVLRCYVSAIDRSTGLHYRAALAFDECFPMPAEEHQRAGDDAVPESVAVAPG